MDLDEWPIFQGHIGIKTSKFKQNNDPSNQLMNCE